MPKAVIQGLTRPKATFAANPTGYRPLAVPQPMGNQATLRTRSGGILQAKLTVNPTNDRHEQEADRVAHAASASPSRAFFAPNHFASPAPSIHAPPRGIPPKAAPLIRPSIALAPSLRLTHPARSQRAEPATPKVPALVIVPTVPSIPHTTSTALLPAVRTRLEPLLGANLAAVRVHTGSAADAAAAAYEARAFTSGNHIYLRSNESPSDLTLIAHETAHAVQQAGRPHAIRVERHSPRDGPTMALTPAPLGRVQRWPSSKAGKGGGEYLLGVIADPLGAAKQAIGAVGDVVAEGFWSLIDRLAPREIADFLHQVRAEGFLGVLKKRISGAVDLVLSTLKAKGGTAAQIAGTFEKLIGQAKPILSALAAGNCKPLFDAVRKLGSTLGEMAGNAWDKIVEFLRPLGEWLQGIWSAFGAPVVGFLSRFASGTWQWIQNIGKRLWDLTQPVRDVYSNAWTEIKNLLGFGDGNDQEGSSGLVGWIQEKAGEAWEGIQREVQPVVEPIKAAASAIADFLPLNAILNLRQTVNEWMDQATAMADNMDQPDDLAENQDLLRDIVLPGIRRAIGTLREKTTSASKWVAGAVGGVVAKAHGFLASLSASTLLSPFKAAFDWLGKEASEIGDWASQKAQSLFSTVDMALDTLNRWLDPIVKLLSSLLAALGNIMDLIGDLIMGPLRHVPKCISEPIKDFIIQRILSQITVFSQFFALQDIWTKVKPAFRAATVALFRDGNLFNAAWTFFRTALSLLGVPPALVTNLIRKAARAIKDIINDPVGFLSNVLAAMRMGLSNFLDNLKDHLLNGAVDWLLSGVKGPGITIPHPFEITFRNVLNLVLQVLDITKEKIFERIEKKEGKEVADKLRKAYKAAEKIVEWVTILIEEGPSGLWRHLEDKLTNLWSEMLDMVVNFLVGKIVTKANLWVAKTLASAGLSGILDAIDAFFNALSVAAQYLKQLLEVANSVFEGISDIAKGVLDKAASMVEQTAARLIPMVLAFLAKTFGIGDLPVVIGAGIQMVRGKVEAAIDKLIEKASGAFKMLKQKAKDAAKAVFEWWKQSKPYTSADGKKHTLKFKGDEATATLTVESTPTVLSTFIANLENGKPTPTQKQKKAIAKIKQLSNDIENIKTKKGKRKDRSSFGVKDGEAIRSKFDDIVVELAYLGQNVAPPPSKVTWDHVTWLPHFRSPEGKAMKAHPLTLNPGGFAGSKPTVESPLWKAANTAYKGLVRGHLLNHHVHGTGADPKNLTPIASGANTKMESEAEHYVKKAVLDEMKIVHYEVEVGGYHSLPSNELLDGKLPKTLWIKGYELERQKTNDNILIKKANSGIFESGKENVTIDCPL